MKALENYLIYRISILCLTALLALSCTTSYDITKEAELPVNSSNKVLSKIAQNYPVYDSSFENLNYKPNFVVNVVPDGAAGPEVSGAIFSADDPEYIFSWYIQTAKNQGWIRFEGGDSYIPYDKNIGFGVLSFHKKERTLSLEFRKKPGWKNTKIAYLGMRYSSDDIID